MGLDQYAFAVRNHPELPVVDAVFSEWNSETGSYDQFVPEDDFEHFASFRKYHDLQGWMENLYRQKGGSSEVFNCNSVEITLDDVNRLEADIANDQLPETTGFFFGTGNTEFFKTQGLEFCQKCRDFIEDGCRIYYDSWW